MLLRSIGGFFLFVGIAWLLSENRRRFPVRIVAAGLGLQVVLAVILLKFPYCARVFAGLNRAVLALQEATLDGTGFVFGYLVGENFPFEVTDPQATFILAFQALPLVLVISALSALLFYWGILQRIVRVFSRFFEKTMQLGGAEGLGISANIFVGMVESPLLIRPYVAKLTRSELFAVMVSGMATIAGTMMVVYASILSDLVPNVMGHILTASIISAPAAVVIAKIMVPETGEITGASLTQATEACGAMDALSRGTLQGMELLLNIIAMIIVLVAMVSLINSGLGLFPGVAGHPLTLQRIFGWLLSPLVWMMGIPWTEAQAAGALLGTKTVLNEMIAYVDMTRTAPEVLSPRSILIMSYALCGFANPGSLGIMIGGLGGMAPERRHEIASLGLRSIIAGTLATCMTGTVAGFLV
ncbi:MAG: nucleoside:proton symporter [Desulfobacterales bacterium]|nr:nucleoside:proton symporter [Desulfobacterales bacterium]